MSKYLDIAGKLEAKKPAQEIAASVPQLRLVPKTEAKSRPFLPRPLGQEDAIDPFIVWEGLFQWLSEHYAAASTAAAPPYRFAFYQNRSRATVGLAAVC